MDMVSEPFQPTAYPDLNEMLRVLVIETQAILGLHLVGIYLSGSLALGDFDPHRSDVDLLVVTDGPLPPDLFLQLRDLHARLIADDLPWAAKLEAIYLPAQILGGNVPTGKTYPVLEKGGGLVLDPLESGWSVQCFTVREHGTAVVGPEPTTLFEPVEPNRMRRAGHEIAEMWHSEALTDPSWLVWLRQRVNQTFVVLTLCRLLYTLELGTVASKPGAAKWALQMLNPCWAELIECAISPQRGGAEISEREEDETVALIHYTVDRFRQWQASTSA